MRLLRAMAAAACTGGFAAAALADPPAGVVQIVREADVKWTCGQFGTGLQTAVLSGDPRSRGRTSSA